METILLKDKTLKDGTVFPKGTKVYVEIKKEDATRAHLILGDRKVVCNSVRLGFLEGFNNVNIETLLEQMYSDNSETLTGECIEPDGWGQDGMPSCELAAGII